MYLEQESRGKSIRFRLIDYSKDKSGKIKKTTLYNFGTFPKSEFSDTSLSLLRDLVQIVQKQSQKSPLDCTDEEYVNLLNDNIKKEESAIYNLGVALLDNFLEFFHLKPFFKRLQRQTKRTYNLFSYFKLILFSQILSPGSLEHYYDQQQRYSQFLPEIKIGDARKTEKFKLEDFYDFLTFYYDHRLEFQKQFFHAVSRLLGKQRIYIFYYDGSNFYFEISQADPDHLDELGEVIQSGLRIYGKSKENRTKPIVAMGIIASDLGIPLFFTVFPGNEQEITHIGEDIRKLKAALADENIQGRMLISADAGNYSGDLIYRLSGLNKQVYNENNKDNDAYVIGRGIGQLDRETRDWVLDPEGYYPISTRKKGLSAKARRSGYFTAVKSRIVLVPLKVKLKSGRVITVKARQKQVAVFSSKRQHRANKQIFARLDKAVLKSQSQSALKQIFKRISNQYLQPVIASEQEEENQQRQESQKEGDKKRHGKKQEIKLELDMNKIDQDLVRAGHFLITTSEVHWPSGKILRVYRDKYISEDIFRELKNILDIRPVYVRTPEHIIAHLELTVLSLIVLNTLRFLIQQEAGSQVSDKKLQESLDKLEAAPVGHDAFRITGIDEIIKSIFETLNIDLEKPVMLRKDILKVFKPH